MYHNIIDDVTRDWGIYDVEQLVPIRRMPRSFIDIMEIHCAHTMRMIGKLYGASQTVVLFRDYVLPKLNGNVRIDVTGHVKLYDSRRILSIF